MFLDASAIVAILTEEDGWKDLLSKVERSTLLLVSSMSLWEAIVAFTRMKATEVSAAERVIVRFVETYRAQIIPVDAEIGRVAVDAFRRFGRGRHPAALNFGDCFAYACARSRAVPLLFKGNDFARTDIAVA